MVKLTPPPSGVQDRMVYDYLYQLQEYLEVSLRNLGSGIGGEDAALQDGGTVVVGNGAVPQAKQSQYEALKALIIKTAEETMRTTEIDLNGLKELIDNLTTVLEGDEATLMAINSSYVAQSEFGTYQEEVNQALKAHGDFIEQQISATEDLQANLDAVSADFSQYRMETEGYIRFGIVGRREDDTPIIGIAIGQNLKVMTDEAGGEITETVTTEDGQTIECRIIRQDGWRAIYAADELSFWSGAYKVAYMNGNRLHITNADVLSQFTVGKWQIQGTSGLVFKWIGGGS